MYLVTVAYGLPTNRDAFDKHYTEIHVPLIDALPGVAHLATGKCEPLDGQPLTTYRVAVLTFENRDAAGAALGSTAGQSAAADIAAFATGGASMSFVDVDPS